MKFKSFIYIAVFFFVVMAGICATSSIASALASDNLKQACVDAPGSPYCQTVVNPPTPTDTTLADTLNKITNFIAMLSAIVAVIILIYGGFRYVVSAGNEQKVTTAKNTILYSVVGLVVVAISRTIVLFVVNYFTSKGGV